MDRETKGGNTMAAPTLQKMYTEKIRAELMKKHSYSSVMSVPKIKKITLNMGLGKALGDKKIIEAASEEMAAISGQKAMITRAKKSIAGFKLREGWPIGCKVTLRKQRLYEFLERLIVIAIPRIRDFRGLSPKSFDGTGNYTFGIQEQIVFPEVDYEKIDAIRGLDITITTSARTDEEAFSLLKAFHFPIKDMKD